MDHIVLVELVTDAGRHHSFQLGVIELRFDFVVPPDAAVVSMGANHVVHPLDDDGDVGGFEVFLDDIEDIGVSPDDTGIFEAIMSLPAKYKTVLDLHYIEGYTANEISEITGVRPDAVRKRLQTGRNRLKKEMERNLNGNDI